MQSLIEIPESFQAELTNAKAANDELADVCNTLLNTLATQLPGGWQQARELLRPMAHRLGQHRVGHARMGVGVYRSLSFKRFNFSRCKLRSPSSFTAYVHLQEQLPATSNLLLDETSSGMDSWLLSKVIATPARPTTYDSQGHTGRHAVPPSQVKPRLGLGGAAYGSSPSGGEQRTEGEASSTLAKTGVYLLESTPAARPRRHQPATEGATIEEGESEDEGEGGQSVDANETKQDPLDVNATPAQTADAVANKASST